MCKAYDFFIKLIKQSQTSFLAYSLIIAFNNSLSLDYFINSIFVV